MGFTHPLTVQQAAISCSTQARRAPSSRSSGAPWLGWHSSRLSAAAAAAAEAERTSRAERLSPSVRICVHGVAAAFRREIRRRLGSDCGEDPLLNSHGAFATIWTCKGAL